MAKKTPLFIVLIIAAIGFAGCDFIQGLFNVPPREDLLGNWAIDVAATTELGTYPHRSFRFTETEMYIYDQADNIVERATINNIDNEGFYYTITAQTFDATLIGQERYSTYTIVEDRLTIQFYDDDTLATRFITFYCDRTE
jgi:hypothetical protein